MREKEAANPKFDFLRNEASEEHLYYKWRLFCLENQYTVDDVSRMEEDHAHKVEWKAPGSIDLLPADKTNLFTMLERNNGSKDAIKALRAWVLGRAHSIQAIGVAIEAYALKLSQEQEDVFTQLLHTAYVVNDLFYNSKHATIKGPYTRVVSVDTSVDVIAALVTYLPSILHCCYNATSEEAQREKVARLVQLWTTKNFLSDSEGVILQATLSSATPPSAAPAPVLTSPYLENPLPSRAPPTPTLLQLQPTLPAQSQPQILPPSNNLPGAANLSEAQLAQLQSIQARIQEQMQYQRLAATLQPANTSTSFAPPGAPLPGMPGPPGMYLGAPLAPAPLIDLARIPVGNMANIVKAAKKAGHTPNTTVDVMMYASHATPHVEPGRVEIKVAEFYRLAEAILNPEAAAAAAAAAQASREEVASARERERHNVSSGRTTGVRSQSSATSSAESGEEGWERYVPGYEEEKERAGVVQDWDRPRPRKHARHGHHHSTPGEAAQDTEITEDNMGHKLLRGLGWQQGSGLGADNSGIVEPISAKQAADRSGVGLNSAGEAETLKDGSVDFSAYRKQLSSHYHSRISERG